MAPVTSIMRAQQIIIARLNELLDPLDLTFPRYEALLLLFYSRSGALPLGKISDRLQVHRASVTNVIDKLTDRGYVERASEPGPASSGHLGADHH
jgi:DNA-binding MarR family transcriptional regulator